ncbi:TetR/AcrR family transcriptional regulator [Enterococcus sp. AZ163]|uniref:TetR/AcrR family transcriptional regulator n=1 Tax=Enterococcus sp. AZ163 TaxID=2774638 RepID=UPI003D2A5E70
MVRTPKIKREKIIEETYNLIIDEGFGKFRVGNIAERLQCSPQPIYREFENLSSLRAFMVRRTLNKYQDFLEDQEPHTLSQLTRSIISYSTDYPEEFHRFFLQDNTTLQLSKEITLKSFNQLQQPYAEHLFNVYWQYVLGKAVLAIATPENHQVTDEFQALLNE